MIKNYGQRYTFPVLMWLTLFFVLPFSIIMVGSFLTKGLYGGFEPGFTLEAYRALFSDTMHKVTINTIFISVVTTVITVSIAVDYSLLDQFPDTDICLDSGSGQQWTG